MAPFDGSKEQRETARTIATASHAREDLSDVEALLRSAALGDETELIGEMSAEHIDGGGKRMRARLALAVADALAVPRDVARYWAAAIETLHNATLIHDDIQDGDTVRRGRPTTWARHGMPQAINAGDLLLMVPVSRLIATAPLTDGARWRLAEILSRSAEEVVRGQGADIDMLRAVRSQRQGDIVEKVTACAEKKTGALFSACAEGAAALAGLDRRASEDVGRPFRAAGVVFQWIDDIIDGFGEKERGQRGNDVREGKVSILVAEHLRLHPGDRDWLLGILERPRAETTDEEVATVLKGFGAGGALDAAMARVRTMASGAEIAATPVLRPLVAEMLGRCLKTLPVSLRGAA